ncbi:transcriptional regulator, TetR family [Catenulispora acidiphila DSM 44928]|uniref:Transcriptional regulator, TetR family n=1 Tax=Catenulispora acidiphila (strain DSM 44928 / JCM 14897 / NBRC 102108 / NRRL B-24433 / ID139908) TaxID=479433 RepID=C7PXW1_CATAD|nr:TetR family transcriptional regulator [Catenulispora acidiphila]ACU73421.1 transcriptional regulator, TetR family [Catenulispora acidiphila DSM 44928]
MPRWEPSAEDRLREAALALFLDRGYENVTVSDITDHAGLTRRTFSRYFADKRDVLFAGSDRLPAVISKAVRDADPALGPAEALLAGLADTGTILARNVPRSPERRRVVAGSAELQERERTKLAAVTDSLTEALQERGASGTAARLLADVGIAVFRTAFAGWTEEPDGADFPVYVHEAAAELTSALAPIAQRD